MRKHLPSYPLCPRTFSTDSRLTIFSLFHQQKHPQTHFCYSRPRPTTNTFFLTPQGYEYAYHASDGSTAAPYRIRLGENTTVMVCVIAVRGFTPGKGDEGAEVMLTTPTTTTNATSTTPSSTTAPSTTPLSYIPVTALAPGETLHQAAVRLMRDDHHLTFVPQNIVSVEDYPSLNENPWLRVCFAGAFETDAHASDNVLWAPVAEMRGEAPSVSSTDFLPLVDAYMASRSTPSLPVGSLSVGFPYNVVEVAVLQQVRVGEADEVDTKAGAEATELADVTVLVEKEEDGGDKAEKTESEREFEIGVLLVRPTGDAEGYWSLPQTHVDRGETIAFAGKRLGRAWFGHLLELEGVAHVEHNGRSDLGLDGIRFTVHSTVLSHSAVVDPDFVPPTAPALDSKIVTASELASLPLIRPDLPLLLASLLTPREKHSAHEDVRGVPLLSVDTTFQEANAA